VTQAVAEEVAREDASDARLRERIEMLEQRLRKRDEHRRALLHILTDSHQSNLKLEQSRKAMIHIMGDLQKTTDDVTRREKELREKQAQLVQAGKLATLGELTTGVAHELNNPLNNIALFIGNVLDALDLGVATPDLTKKQLNNALLQVAKATEIISHLRTFGRAAPASRESVRVNEIVERALSLMDQQLRGRQIQVKLDLSAADPRVMANAIQLEQVFINLFANARDALTDAKTRRIDVRSAVVRDTGGADIQRHGRGNPRRARAAHLRPVLHDQGRWRGHGAGAVDHIRHREGPPGHDLGPQAPAGRGRDVPHSAAARGCVGHGRRGGMIMNTSKVLIVDDDPGLLEALPGCAAAAHERGEHRHLRLGDVRARLHRAHRLRRDHQRHQDARHGRAGAARRGAHAPPGDADLLITGHGEHDLAVQALRGGRMTSSRSRSTAIISSPRCAARSARASSAGRSRSTRRPWLNCGWPGRSSSGCSRRMRQA
jgi:nitrogen-specific signal transduction histidine kinase